MGKKKEVVFYRNRYKGQKLSEETCDRLESLLELDKAGNFVKELQHVIFDLSASEVDQIKELKSGDMLEPQYGTLKNNQTIGVAYMYFAKSCILGDSVGMGKTVQVCGLCNLLEAEHEKAGSDFRFLFLTGKNLVEQTRDKMIKFTGNYIETLYGLKPDVTRYIAANEDYPQYSIVGSHSLLTNKLFQDYMAGFRREHGYNPFDLLVIDEAGDVLTNTATQRYKDAKYLAEMFDRVVLLNATSFEKELKMFYNQLNFIDETFLPTKTAFEKEYMVFTYGIASYPVFQGKYRNEDKFKRLVAYRYLARTRKSSGATMIDCSADIIVSPLSQEQRELLRLTSIPAMVYECPGYFRMGYETNLETTPKLRDLVKLLREDLKDEPSILIYSRYKESQSAIQRVLYNELGVESTILNGASSQKERNAVIDKFKLGDIRLLITNVQKGLDFGKCNVCIFYSYDPNPNKMVQFEGRMTRDYDIVGKHVYLLISKGSELTTFKKTVADRAKASDIFAGSDFSCVLSILLDDNILSNIS